MSAKYVFQLRRGWKGIDRNGNTTYEDGTPIDDWAKYEAQETHIKPLEGELVLEYDNGVPRLKIGDGINEFSALPYMSVDSFILPKPVSVTLYADKWEQVVDADGVAIANTHSQVVTVDNAVVTKNSKVDLLLSAEQLAIFYDKDIAFVTENEDGVVTVYTIGDRPQNDYTIQATVTEVIV